MPELTKKQIAARLNELNQRGLSTEQLRNRHCLITRRPLTVDESDEVVSYFKLSEISDFSDVVRAELSIQHRPNLGRTYWPSFRLFKSNGSCVEPSLQQATETRKHYVTRHLRESVQREIDEFMRPHRGKVAHHVIPFAELVDAFRKAHNLSLDDLFAMVKAGEMSLFSRWHQQNAVLMAVTKREHHNAHGWKKPSSSEGNLFPEEERA
jgi:hypothetical protein